MPQHYGTIAVGGLNPQEVSDLVLTSGSYSLSTLSTVPYIQLLGPSGSQKLFSWNERIEIPNGETARIQNASCHKGDVFINGGLDYTTLPGRITVPVPFADIVDLGEGNSMMYPDYPVDTRRARRAFLTWWDPAVVIGTESLPTSTALVIIKGTVLNHSHSTVNGLTGVVLPSPVGVGGIGYLSALELAALTITPMIPLGYGAAFTDSTNPHTLLDCAIPYLFFDNQWTEVPQTAYYVLEY